MTRGDSPTVGRRSPAQAPRRQIILTTQTLRGCFLTALLVAACAPAMATQISVDPRVEEEVARGRSRVLVELRAPERADGLQLFGSESRPRRLSRENALDLKPRLGQDDHAQGHRALRGSQIELVLDARPSHFPHRHVREPSFRCTH